MKQTEQLRLFSLLFLALISISESGICYGREKLFFTVDLIRHGDRAPVADLPQQPYTWEERLGKLTATGKLQQKTLGQRLRKEYIEMEKHLPDTYTEGTLYVRATDRSRTKRSADALLDGLYPEGKRKTSVPVHVFKREDDKILLVQPKSEAWLKVEDQYWNERIGTQGEKLENWRQLSGMTLRNFDELNYLADNLLVRGFKKIALPVGFEKKEATEIISLAEQGRVMKFKNSLESQAMGRAFLNEVIRFMSEKIHGKSPLQSAIYLAHDSTLMSVMATLNSPLHQIPPYASRLHFSLIEDQGEYQVRTTFNDQPVQETIKFQDFLDSFGGDRNPT
jgi:broad specificity phosphatase PhoE